ncbi:MAG: hypothetical protein JXQ73_17625 [Phycisphaerae bacterium]|nr:hypothetical protein [Phycisphaerae bacterium]
MMTALSDIEVALLQRLSTLRIGAHGAFRSVDGLVGASKQRVLAHLSRQRMPAVLACYEGRKVSSGGTSIRVCLYVATESLRGGREARTGGPGVLGIHALLDCLRGALDQATLLGGCRLSLASEGSVAGDDRTAVYEQIYAVEETA